MVKKALISYFFFFFLLSSAFSQKSSDKSEVNDKEREVYHKEFKTGTSIVPVVAANSTYGIMLGSALVRHLQLKNQHKVMVMTIFTARRQYYTLIDYNMRTPKFLYGITTIWTDFFEPNYPSIKDKSGIDMLQEIQAYTVLSRPYIAYYFNENISAKFIWTRRSRAESGSVLLSNGETLHKRVIPDELGHTFALNLIWDDKKQYIGSIAPLGTYFNLNYEAALDSSFNSLPNFKPFALYGADWRHYIEIFDNVHFAYRLWFNSSLGEPTYLFKYKLGGDLPPRGFRAARFRTNKFLASQNELRFPIWTIFSGSLFIEKVDFPPFGSSLNSYGGGLKVDLPPDGVAKIRLDLGFGQEGSNFSMYFDHAF